MVKLMDVAGAVKFLQQHELLRGPVRAATELRGGVSCVVVRVQSDLGDLVVKQARERLAVADDWRADPARSHVEAVTMRLLSSITPRQVPKMILEDVAQRVVVMSAVPSHYQNLKTQLLTGVVESVTGGAIGRLLRQWQDQLPPSAIPPNLRSKSGFRELRIDPYFMATARRLPQESDAICAVADDTLARAESFTHGDFSPKNVMSAGGTDFVVLDFEVGHLGDQLFDVAFWSSHLLLKWCHLPKQRDQLACALGAFLGGYAGTQPVDAKRLSRLVGCLLLARVVGSSPVEYLTPEDQQAALRAGRALLHDAPELPNLAQPQAWLAAWD